MVNKVILIGNLGRDPELRYTQNGTPVASLNLATSRRWKGQDGQMQEQTEWHKVVVWSRLAELCNEYLSKGAKVYVEGRLQTRKWQDQNGNERYTTEVVAQDVQFLTPRGATVGGGGHGGTFNDGSQGGFGGDDFSGSEPPPTGDDVPF
ncbi:MAG TPA: single-stranded DNA-binding protein [Desulfobulbus sp.]|nr:single-stranded DNA-binding protein [Desulfobulbus sp.]